jgi:PIN domain nuclease of toxin-antitoxin system
MTLLLDTHAVIWMAEGLPELGKGARQACRVALAINEIAVPAIAFYELGRLLVRGRVAGLPAIVDWRRRLIALGIREIPVSSEIAMSAAELGNLHLDPIDGIIVATALAEDAVLRTADGHILEWPGELKRQDARR